MDVERFDDAGFDDAGFTLLDRLDRRSTPSSRELTREFLEVGEWALFVDELAAELFRDQVPIDATERDLLRGLLYAFARVESDEKDYPMIWRRDEVLAALNVVDGVHSRAG